MSSLSSVLLASVSLLHSASSQGSNFADNLASCAAASSELNTCLSQTLEDLRPLMRTGITKLGLPPTEPMNIESMEFAQGAPPVIVKASFSNVVVKGLSNFITNFIEVDPTSRLLRIGLTVPEMDIAGLYRINGEVFILPLEGGGSFSSKMSRVTATGHSTILPYTNEEGNQVLQVENFNVDFTIGHVFIQMNNLFNGENQLLAETVNKFLNDHSQEVIKEVKPSISRQLSVLVTRVMNDAFSELPADKLLDNIKTGNLEGVVALPSTPPLLPPAPAPPLLATSDQVNTPRVHHALPLHKQILGPQQRLGQRTKARLIQLFTGRK